MMNPYENQPKPAISFQTRLIPRPPVPRFVPAFPARLLAFPFPADAAHPGPGARTDPAVIAQPVVALKALDLFFVGGIDDPLVVP